MLTNTHNHTLHLWEGSRIASTNDKIIQKTNSKPSIVPVLLLLFRAGGVHRSPTDTRLHPGLVASQSQSTNRSESDKHSCKLAKIHSVTEWELNPHRRYSIVSDLPSAVKLSSICHEYSCTEKNEHCPNVTVSKCGESKGREACVVDAEHATGEETKKTHANTRG